MKKSFLILKLSFVTFILFFLFLFIVIIVSTIGFSAGIDSSLNDLNELRLNTTVINNQIYSQKYRSLLDKYLFSYGYISLERLVFYLQRENNVLDTSVLSYETWENAYIKNSDTRIKQMLPIKTICKEMNSSYPQNLFSVQNGKNENDIAIDRIDLCYVGGIDISSSSDYNENSAFMPYSFPLHGATLVNITSFVNEQRNIDFNLPEEELNATNHHSGWDIATKAETSVFSICSGVILDIVFTQNENIPFNESKNRIGNYIRIKCNLTHQVVTYRHLFPNSYDYKTIRKNEYVEQNQFIAKVGTTGQSTGNHLHLELSNEENTLIDAFSFINFENYFEG